jgi:hypothetical protein
VNLLPSSAGNIFCIMAVLRAFSMLLMEGLKLA